MVYTIQAEAMVSTSGAYKARGLCCSARRRIADIYILMDAMPAAFLLQYVT